MNSLVPRDQELSDCSGEILEKSILMGGDCQTPANTDNGTRYIEIDILLHIIKSAIKITSDTDAILRNAIEQWK